jgi:hypothetical protein
MNKGRNMKMILISLVSIMCFGCLPEGTTTQIDLASDAPPVESIPDQAPELVEIVDDPEVPLVDPPVVTYMNKVEIDFVALESVVVLVRFIPACTDPCPFPSMWQDDEITDTLYNLDAVNNKIVFDVRKAGMIKIKKMQGDLDLIWSLTNNGQFITSFNFDQAAEPLNEFNNVLNVMAFNPEFTF